MYMDKKQPVQGAGLHMFIATGGKPEDYEGTKGMNKDTVPGYTEEGEKENTNNKKQD